MGKLKLIAVAALLVLVGRTALATYTPVPARPSSGGGGGAGVTDGDKGDIVVSGSGATWTVDANVVTYAKFQQLPTLTLVGNNTGGTTNALSLTVSQVNTMLGVGVLANPLSQFASTTSSQLRGIITDPTGSGGLVFATSPTLVTPALGVATATSVNKITFTQPATGSTLTLSDGVTLTVPSSLNTSSLAPLASPTFTGTVTLPAVTLGGAFAAGGKYITNIGGSNWTLTNDGNKSGAAPALADFTTTQEHTMVVSANITGVPTWTWPSLSSADFYAHMEVCQPSSGGPFTIAGWPTSPTLTWVGGSAPTLSTAASACDYISFRYDGTKVVGYFMAALAALPLSGGTMTGPILGAKGYSVAAASNVNKSGASVALCDFSASTNCEITVTANITGTSTCTMPGGDTNGITIYVHQPASGGPTTVASWCPNTHWVGVVGTAGSAPTLSTAASALDIISCKSKGSNLYCQAGTSN